MCNDFFPPFFVLQGRFTIAAKHHISIAEIYESELVDIEKVMVSCNQIILPTTVKTNYGTNFLQGTLKI